MTVIPTDLPAFYPETNSTLACGTGTGSTALLLGARGDTLLLSNDGGATAFLAFGSASTTVTAGGAVNATTDGGMALLPGAVMTVRVDNAFTHIVGITSAGTTTVRISRGSGV